MARLDRAIPSQCGNMRVLSPPLMQMGRSSRAMTGFSSNGERAPLPASIAGPPDRAYGARASMEEHDMAEVAVVGAGLMGHALALVFALGGHKVRLTDNNPQTLDRAPGLMATALATLTEAGEADAGIGSAMAVDRRPLRAVAGGDGEGRLAGDRGRRRAPGRQAHAVRSARDADGAGRDPGEQHLEPGYLSAGARRAAGADDHRALVYAALSMRPRGPLPRIEDEAGGDRDRARHGRGDGQGAGRVQADGARLRCQPSAGGDAAWRCTACSTKAW